MALGVQNDVEAFTRTGALCPWALAFRLRWSGGRAPDRHRRDRRPDRIVSSQRSAFGAVQSRLGYTLENAAIYQENLTASESRIRDVDMAKEMVNFTKLQILQQAGTSMLAQANTSSQGVLTLLR